MQRGHAGAHEYGWSWFLRCLEASAANERADRAARLADLALALRAAPEQVDERVQALEGENAAA